MLPSSLLSLLLLPLAASLASASSSTVEEEYTEDLRIRPLPDGKVNAHFRFVTHLNQSDSSKGTVFVLYPDGLRCALTAVRISLPGHHYLSPSPLLALLHAHEAQGFDLALTAGLWDHSRWGYPLGNTGGTGAELWAWMREGELRGR
jgi:phosphatidylinositol glycan class T